MKCRDRHKSLGNDAQYKYIETNKGKPGSIYKLFQEVGAGEGLKSNQMFIYKNQ